jgi:hypothetical protein
LSRNKDAITQTFRFFTNFVAQVKKGKCTISFSEGYEEVDECESLLEKEGLVKTSFCLTTTRETGNDCSLRLFFVNFETTSVFVKYEEYFVGGKFFNTFISDYNRILNQAFSKELFDKLILIRTFSVLQL